MNRFDGKTVLITGGAKGIGLSTAKSFAEAGATLILVDVDAKALADAYASLKNTTKVHTRALDISDEQSVLDLADWVHSDFGSLDVLINNAGIGYQGQLADTSTQTWKKLIAVNLLGPIYHINAFLPAMIERGSGHIVNVSSGQAFFRMPSWGAYAAIKAALAVLSEVLYYEVKKSGINVTTVYPYMVNTGFYDNIEGTTWAARMSMKLLPYYSDKPDKVGRLIFKAVVKKKQVEMINPINDIGFYGRMIPYFSKVISRTSAFLLAGKR